MKNKTGYLYWAIGLTIVFFIYTLFVFTLDVEPIGAMGTNVGFSALNKKVHGLTNENLMLYRITDLVQIPAVLVAIFFAFVGLFQLIKRKNLFLVDGNILALGLAYILAFIVYFVFLFVVINYRPILIENKLESSYPSSTTVLSLVFCTMAHFQVKNYVKKGKFRTIILYLNSIYSAFLVVARIISGVHWITDIIGAIIISISIVFYYLFFEQLFSKISKKWKR